MRLLTGSVVVCLVLAALGSAPAATPPAVPTDLAWHDVTTWGVEGRGWADQERKRWFDRFPAKAAAFEPVLREALGLAGQ
jgi:hypothetical protein